MIAETKLKYVIDRNEVQFYEAYPDGELNFVDQWSIPELDGATYNSFEELLIDINQQSEGVFTTQVKDYTCISSYGDHIQADTLVDVDMQDPSYDDINLWENGELDLYNARLEFSVHVIEEHYLNCVLDTAEEREFTEDDARDLGLCIA